MGFPHGVQHQCTEPSTWEGLSTSRWSQDRGWSPHHLAGDTAAVL